MKQPINSNTKRRMIVTIATLLITIITFLVTKHDDVYTAVEGHDESLWYTKATNTSTTSITPSFSPITHALKQIRLSVLDSKETSKCPEPIWIDSGKETYQVIWPLSITVSGIGNKERYKGKGRFPCNTNVAWEEGREIKSCGDEIMKYMHPFIWECRLKERLLNEIELAQLTDCAYGFLDVGSALGDWVIAMSGKHRRAKFASAEANPETAVTLLRNYDANGLVEEERVYVYPFAVGISNPNEVREDWITADIIWPQYSRGKIAHVLDWPGSSLCMPIQSGQNLGGFSVTDLPAGLLGNSCKVGVETNVPIVSVSEIMNDWQGEDHSQLNYGGLFAVKVDVEGAEAGVIKSAMNIFTNHEQRPCMMYFELKKSEAYKEAFVTLLELGYTEVIDVDSGKTGKDSYPPQGSLYSNEGNYEFKLASDHFQKCIDRVKQNTCKPI